MKDALSRAARYHAVRFYDSDRSLAHIVGGLLADGLTERSPAVVIATAAHRAAIVRELVARQHDVVELQRAGDLLLLDAQNTLDTLMSNGTVEDAKFNDVVCGIVRTACRGRVDCTVRAYGELVDLLWKNGRQDSAVRLEMLWNQLTISEPFSLLCGCAMGHCFNDARFNEVRRLHTHVISADGTSEHVAGAASCI